MSFYKSRKFQQMRREVSKKDMFDDHNMLRFFLVLHFGDVTEKQTLTSKYNLTTAQITKYSQQLQEKGYILTTTFNNLDENIQLSLLNGSIAEPHKLYEKSAEVQVYTITETGKQKGKEILKQKLEEAQENPSLMYLIKQISEYTHNYRKKIRLLNSEEEILLPRHIEYPTKGGKLLVQRPSYRQTQRRLELKNAVKSTSLVEVKDTNKYIKTVTYQPSQPEFEHYRHIGFKDIETTLERENKEIDKQIELDTKESKKRAEIKLKENEMYWTHKDSLTKDEEKYLDKEAMSFLDSL